MGGGRRYSLGIQGDLEQSFEDGLELTTQSKTPYDGERLPSLNSLNCWDLSVGQATTAERVNADVTV